MTDPGIAIALIGTTAYNTGFVVQKRALSRLPVISGSRPVQLLRTLFTAPGWLVGFGCMLVGLACQTVVLTLLPITIAQPLQASGIGVLLVLSWFVLKERIGPREWWRIAAVGCSVVLLGLSQAGSSTPSAESSGALAMVAVVLPSVVVACGLYLGAISGGRHSVPATGAAAGLATGLFYGVAGLGLKGLSSAVAHDRLGGIVAAVPFSPYLYLAGLALAGGMVVFQTSLQRCRASVLVPTANVAGSCYFVVLGTFLFHETLPSQPIPLALRIAGLTATALALAIQPAAARPTISPSMSVPRGGTLPCPSTNGYSTSSPVRSTRDRCCISPTRQRSTTLGCIGCTASSPTSR